MDEQQSGYVPFTQYLLPHGRTRQVSIGVGGDAFDKAQTISANGFRFECEVLTTGDVSLTIFDPVEEEDVAIKVIPNGPGVREAVEELINGYPA